MSLVGYTAFHKIICSLMNPFAVTVNRSLLIPCLIKYCLMKPLSHDTYDTSVFDSRTTLFNVQRYTYNTLFFNSIARYQVVRTLVIIPFFSICVHLPVQHLPCSTQSTPDVMLLCWFPPLLSCMSLEDIVGQCTIICQ